MQINDADPQYPYPPDKLIQLALAHIESQFKHDGPISAPKLAADYFRLKLGQYEREIFAVLFLCNRHYVIGYEELFLGTLNGASVHPREIVKSVLYRNAAAVILGHNHPSGIAEPSQSDIQITRRITEALCLIDVKVLDHIVVGGADFVSFSDRGLMWFSYSPHTLWAFYYSSCCDWSRLSRCKPLSASGPSFKSSLIFSSSSTCRIGTS